MLNASDVKKLTALPVLLALVAASLSAQGDSLTKRRPPAGFTAELDAYIAQAVRDWEVPGIALAVVRNDTVLVAKGYGVRELGKPDLVDGNTLFDIASLTKSFTAAGAAILVDEGKLRWDDLVRQHVPSIRFPSAYLDSNVTLRDVLSHRTGLNPSNWIMRFLGEARDLEPLHRVRYLKTSAPFRTTLVYSNIGYTIAGAVTAAAAKVPWAEFIQTRLVKPLGMDSSYVNGGVPASGNVARTHVVLGGRQQPVRASAGVQDGPSAGVRSTASDMARWLRFQINRGELDGKRLVSERAMEETQSPQLIIPVPASFRRARLVEFFPAYGLGWQVMDYRGRPMMWHSGSADGMPSYMAILPNQRLGVVVLVNSWIAPTLHGAIVQRILDTYLGVELRDWSAEALAGAKAQRAREAAALRALAEHAALRGEPAHPLAAYAGVYADSLYGPIRVWVEQGRLALQMGRGEVADLTSHGGDSAFVRWRDPLFGETFSTHATFTADAGGHIVRLSMPLARDTITAARSSVSRQGEEAKAPRLRR